MTCVEHDSFLEEYDEPEPMSKAEAFRVDYEWFRSFGMNDWGIARQFGISEDALHRRMQRAGISTVAPHVVEALDELVASGREFTVDELPYTETQNIAGLLNQYVHEQRIQPIRKVRSGRYDGTRTTVYRATAGGDQ
jgi:hypothetical protein